MLESWNEPMYSRPQRPRSFWSEQRNTTSGKVQHRKSAICKLPVTLSMVRVKSDNLIAWFSTHALKTGPSHEVGILDADHKECGLWGQEWNKPLRMVPPFVKVHMFCTSCIAWFDWFTCHAPFLSSEAKLLLLSSAPRIWAGPTLEVHDSWTSHHIWWIWLAENTNK